MTSQQKHTDTSDDQFLKEHHDELSRSAQRAHWIHSPDEHEEHHGQTLATHSHEVIQRWAEERNAQPSTVPGTNRGDREGVLRFNFPGYGGDRLEAISWEQFFKTFDERNLIFLFQEHMKAGNQSNFFHLERVDNDESDERASGSKASGSKASESKTSGAKASDSHSSGAKSDKSGDKTGDKSHERKH